MSTAILLLKTYLKFYVTTKRFLVIIPLFLFLFLIFPVLIAAGVVSKPADDYAWATLGFSNFSSNVALVAGLLAGDALSQDFSRQGLFTLTQPIRRSVIMLARYGSAALASIIVMVVAWWVPGLIVSEVFYQSLVPSTPEIFVLSMVFIASIVAFVVLFSSLFKSSTISIVLSIVFLLILMPTISMFLPFAGVEPWFFITYAGGALGALAQRTYPPHVQQATVLGFGPGAGSGFTITTYTPSVPEAAAIIFAYLIVSLALAWFVYSRRELKDVS